MTTPLLPYTLLSTPIERPLDTQNLKAFYTLTPFNAEILICIFQTFF